MCSFFLVLYRCYGVTALVQWRYPPQEGVCRDVAVSLRWLVNTEWETRTWISRAAAMGIRKLKLVRHIGLFGTWDVSCLADSC